MGDMPLKGQKAGDKPEDPIKKILKSQTEAAAKANQPPPMMKTGDGAQIVFDPATETGHVKTSAAAPRAEATPEADASSEDVSTTEGEEAREEEPLESLTPAPADETEPVVAEAETSTTEETAAAKAAPTATAEGTEGSEGHVKDEL